MADHSVGVFDEIADLGLDDNGEVIENPEGTGEGDAGKPSPKSKGNGSDPKLVEKLQKDFENVQENNRGLKEEIEKLGKGQEILTKLQSIFTETDDVGKEKERKVLLEHFDTDPVGFIEKVIAREVGKVQGNLDDANVDRFAKQVMTEIDLENEVDWKKDSKKIVEQLANFTEEAKRKDPKGCTLKAMQLAGVGKKRNKPLPFYESSGLNDPEVIKKRQDTEQAAYKKGIMERASESNRDAFDIFFGKSKKK